MTEIRNEYLPFADIEDDPLDVIQRRAEDSINQAFETQEIDENTYRRLVIEVNEVHGEPHAYFIGILKKVLDAMEITTIERIEKGAEFIESIGVDDPRYEIAVAKYEKLHEKLRRYNHAV